jgi:hypothetical protein
MTSFAFIFGVLPLILRSGAGAEMRQALGVAVFSGMLGVTFFGIFLTPVFFYTLRRFGERQQPSAHGAPVTEKRRDAFGGAALPEGPMEPRPEPPGQHPR